MSIHPTARVNDLLDLSLNDQNKYIKVAKDTRKISATDFADVEKQKRLLERAIEKLTNTTGYKLYTSSEDSMDTKAGIIAEVFFNKWENIEPNLLNYYCFELANAFRYRIISYHSHPFPQTTEKLYNSTRHLSISTPRPKDEQKIPSSHLTTSDSSSSPKKLRTLSVSTPMLIPQGKQPHEKERSPRKLKSMNHIKDSKSQLHPRGLLLEMENAQALVAKEISTSCLSYCYYYWLYQYTKKEDHKYLMEQCQEKITISDRSLLFENNFLDKPQLDVVSKEQNIRVLIEAGKYDGLFEDIERTLEHAVVWDVIGTDLFHYDEKIELVAQEDIAQHNCKEFERFLTVLVKQLEDDSKLTSPPVLDIWKKTCIPKANNSNGKKITNFCFVEAGKKFLHEIEDHSRMKEDRGIKFKLKQLLCAFYQGAYTTSAQEIILALPAIKCYEKTSNRSNLFKFLSSSKVEIYIRNTLKFCTNEEKDFIQLGIENKFIADLSNFTSWSADLTVQLLPSIKANTKKIDDLVLKPLNAMGIDVHQKKSLPLRKSATSASSSSSSRF